MATGVGEIKLANSQAARDTEAIAEKASGVLSMSRTVAQAADETLKSAEQLKQAIARFRMERLLDFYHSL